MDGKHAGARDRRLNMELRREWLTAENFHGESDFHAKMFVYEWIEPWLSFTAGVVVSKVV